MLRKISVKRGVWAVEEDAKLLSFVSKNGSGNWTSVSKKAGLKSCGKSCRVRWNNHLRPDLKQDNFNPQEEDLIIKLHAAIGSRWSIIAQQLPGRTDNDVKNYWNARLKKKLSQMGIDPVTHKPFSKLIADYGNISGSSEKSSTINKDLKNAIQLKPEPQGFRNFNSQSKQPPTSPPPKIEPTENSFLFNRNHADNLSIDHTQHQGIPIVTSASNCINLDNETIPIFGEGCFSTTSSSSPSTSSTYSTAAQEALPVPFSWNDFLLEDAFASNVDNQEQKLNVVSQIENVTRQSWNNRKEDLSQQATSNEFQLSSSSNDITFVEAMLGHENEMFLSFPHLMEEPFNY